MAYKNGKYYWIQNECSECLWEVGRYRETHSPGAPLNQRFELCGSNRPVAIDLVYKIGPPVDPYRPEGSDEDEEV